MGFTHLQIEWTPWLRGWRPQIPVLSTLHPQLNLLNPPKFLGTPLHSVAGDMLQGSYGLWRSGLCLFPYLYWTWLARFSFEFGYLETIITFISYNRCGFIVAGSLVYTRHQHWLHLTYCRRENTVVRSGTVSEFRWGCWPLIRVADSPSNSYYTKLKTMQKAFTN
jgi:hypothetical protein